MTSSTHKITAIDSGSHDVFGDWEVEHTITFRYTPGSRPTQIDPGSGPTVELVSVGPRPDAPCAFQDLADKRLHDWAEQWLEDHEDQAIAAAHYDLEAEADERADFQRRSRIDDQLTEARQ